MQCCVDSQFACYNRKSDTALKQKDDTFFFKTWIIKSCNGVVLICGWA